MSTSYQISEQYNFQSVLFALAGAAYRGAVAVRAWLRGLLAALRVLAITLGLFTGLVACVAIVAVFWLPLLQFVGCLALIVAFAYVTYPKGGGK